jgi:CRP-like cAMP-binding protein
MGSKGRTSAEAVRTLLKTVEIFEGLTADQLKQIAAAGTIERLERGELLFERGDPADRIHLILDGAIEILRATPDHPEPTPVAYLSPGELVGDMALFTGSERKSSGRVPEFAEIWTLTRKVFDHVEGSIPNYGMRLARMFARRLEDFISHMRRQARRKELSGKLKYFDMPTVVQTLVTSGQTGVLTLIDDEGRTIAEVLLREGAVDRAKCGDLEGEEGFYEIFLRGDEGEFVFRTATEIRADEISSRPVALTAMNLLIEAMRLKDELPKVRSRLPDPDQEYQAVEKSLTWEDAVTKPIARTLLKRLSKPRAIDDLVGEFNCSTMTFYEVAAGLFETGQIEPADDR